MELNDILNGVSAPTEKKVSKMQYVCPKSPDLPKYTRMELKKDGTLKSDKTLKYKSKALKYAYFTGILGGHKLYLKNKNACIGYLFGTCTIIGIPVTLILTLIDISKMKKNDLYTKHGEYVIDDIEKKAN